MHGWLVSWFFFSGSSPDRQFLPFLPISVQTFVLRAETWFFSTWDMKRDARDGGKTQRPYCLCWKLFFSTAKIVSCFNMVGMIAFNLELSELWTFISDKSHVCAELSIGEIYWKLTPVVWSNPLVIPHLKTIENRRYVHLRWKKTLIIWTGVLRTPSNEFIDVFTSPTVELPPCPRSLLKKEHG